VPQTLPDTSERAQHVLLLQTTLGHRQWGTPRAMGIRRWKPPIAGRSSCADRWERRHSSLGFDTSDLQEAKRLLEELGK
jgi:hypothetical protein